MIGHLQAKQSNMSHMSPSDADQDFTHLFVCQQNMSFVLGYTCNFFWLFSFVSLKSE